MTETLSESCSKQTSSGGICRACMLYDDSSRMIFLFESNNNLAEIFSKCTSLATNNMDDLPKHICLNCHNDLVNYNKFRLLCTASDSHFRQNVKCKIESSNEEENENLIIDENELIEHVEERLQSDQEDCDVIEEAKETCSEDNILETSNPNSADCAVKTENESDEEEDEQEEDGSKSEIVSKKSLSCEQCEKKFFKSHRLEGHLRQHQGLKPCVCQKCGKSFSKWSGLSLHMSGWHNDKTNNKRYPCDVKNCDKAYNMKQSLNLHKKMSHSDPNAVQGGIKCICEVCGKSFKATTALKKHTYTHTGYDNMPYSCNICPKKYSTKHKLKEHTMRHDGIKNHVCPFCGLRKTTPYELKVHINYHTREKLYPCKLCNAEFSSIGNMSRHFKIVHCGIKAYNCTICDRSFGKSETLKHHIFTHTGEKPHACTICNKRFIQSIALQTHMKTHKKVTT